MRHRVEPVRVMYITPSLGTNNQHDEKVSKLGTLYSMLKAWKPEYLETFGSNEIKEKLL